MSDVRIDTHLYKKEILKKILMDNMAIQQEEFRPLYEFRECMKEHAREYFKAALESSLVTITSGASIDDVVELHEQEFYQ